MLGPQQTLTRNVRANLTDLNVNGAFATGLIVITQTGGNASDLEGDYFRVDSANDFATGDRLVRLQEFCARQEIRFIDFGSGSDLQILLAAPQGDATSSFSYVAYNEAGAMVSEGEVFTFDNLVVLDARDLVPDESFGSLVFDFANAGSGFVTAEYSAFGRYSVELNGACRDLTGSRGQNVAELIVPGFEVEVGDPEGPTTFFAVRNTTDDDVEIDVAYYGEEITGEPLRTDLFMLGPQQTLTRNVRANLTDLNVGNGFATGLIVLTKTGGDASGLEGDYFRVDSRNDFATGDRLVPSEAFCTRQEIRFIDFGSGSVLQILLEEPQGSAVPSFSYAAYTEEGGTMVAEGDIFTSEHLTVIDSRDLVPGESFGSLVFDFSAAGGGFVTAEYSAFGRYSVELNGACTEE